MLNIVLYVLAALVAIIVLVLLIASRRQDEFSTSRSALIAATPETLFSHIDSLRAMNKWNPYALRETGGVANYSGPESGPGARFDFAGPKSGSGFIEILESRAPQQVIMRLMMLKPFKADNRVDLSLKPQGEATQITWTMSGRQPLMAKVMGMLIDCDAMVGRDFEEGLANLKKRAEAP